MTNYRKSSTLHSGSSFVAFALLSLATLALGGWLTSQGRTDGWYASLQKPPFQPPDWAFGPAWISIMTLTAIATWRIWRAPVANRKHKTAAYALYALQLTLNIGWSALFFYWHQPTAALVEILAFNLVLAGMIYTYRRLDVVAAWLLVPYQLWLLFATSLNAWIVANN